MTTPLIRQGEGAAGIHRHMQDLAAQRHELDRIINLAHTAPDLDSTRLSIATAGGDEQKLRGIPAIGRGVTGAIRGSSPGRIW